jgi:hypothetical protein
MLLIKKLPLRDYSKSVIFIVLFFLSHVCWCQEESPNSIKIPDTIVYSLSDGRSIIEIDRESAWQRDVDWHESFRPRALEWSSLIPLPERNVILIRNREKVITQVFNSDLSLSYWNSILVKGKNAVSANDIKADAFFHRGNRYPYMGNLRVCTHLKNGYYLINHVNPDAHNSINRLDGKHLGLLDPAGNIVFPIIYEYIELVGTDYLVKKDRLVGIINRESEIIVPLQYEFASVKQDGSVLFTDHGKVKKVYKSRIKKVSVLEDYDWIDDQRLDEAETTDRPNLIMVRKNGKYGFINRRFEVVIPANYDFIWYANREGLIRVCNNNQWGFLNHKGEVVIPFVYDDAIEFYQGKTIVRKSENTFCLDMNGNPTTGCIERYANWEIKEGGGMNQYITGRRIVARDQLKGIIDDDGRLVCPIIYNHIIGMESNTSEYRWDKSYYKASINNRYGIIDKNGKVKVPLIYDEIVGFKGGIELYTIKLNDRYGLMDKDFKVILPCEFEGLDFVTCKGQYWFLKNGKWGMMDKDLKVIIQPQYDQHGWMYHGKIKVQTKKHYGIIDSTGRIIIPAIYEALAEKFNNGLIAASLNKKWGFLDSLNHVVIPFEYDDVRNFYKNIAGVKKGNKYFFINKKNESVNNNLYDFIDHDWIWNGMIKVINKGKSGVVNEEGVEVLPCEYDEINGYSRDKGLYLIKNKKGVWIKL